MTHPMVKKVKQRATIHFPKMGMSVQVRNIPNRPRPSVDAALWDNRSANATGRIVEVLKNYDSAVIIVELTSTRRHAAYWLDEATELPTDE